MLVSCFKAQSFNNYSLAQNKMPPTSFCKRGWSFANTKTHHLSIPHFTERKEDLNFPTILFKIVFSAHFSMPCQHYLEQTITYQSSQLCGVSFPVIFKLIAFDIWHSSSRNLFLIIQIIITKEINKSYFFIMDAIIKKFPRSIDVSHEANRINKSDLGT